MSSFNSIRTRILLCGLLLGQGASAYAQNLSGYSVTPLELPADTSEIVLVDADRDGLQDLLAVRDNQLDLYFQQEAGGSGGEPQSAFDFSRPASLVLPGRAVGWDISASFSSAGSASGSAGPGFAIVALMEGSRVSAWPLQGREFGDEQPVLEGLAGFLGHGFYRLRFVQDINNDDTDDLLIPGAGELALHIQNPDGSYQQPVHVQSDMSIQTSLYSDRDLERDVGQSLRIPMMELRDVNSDDSPDLISRTEERFDVFLARPGQGKYFSSVSSYSIDRNAIRQRLGTFDVDQLDFSNLTGVLSLTHEELLEDVDNDGLDDFILREGGKVSLFFATAGGVDFSAPRQVLRSGGNVLTTFLYDEDEDGLKDLWLWRVESVSVGDIFLWLAISGSLDIEAFIYPNTGDGFARRPARRLTVTLRFPSAVRVMSSVNELRRAARESGGSDHVPTATAQLSPGPDEAEAGTEQDLLALVGNRLDVFLNAADSDNQQAQFLGSLNYSRSRDSYEIDVSRIIDEVDVSNEEALPEPGERSPDYSIDLDREQRQGRIFPGRLNQDGRDDLLVFLSRDSEAIYGAVLLSE